jgi:hypothetical protein
VTDKLNPKIRKMPVGIKTIREVTVYPLSVGAQLEMTDLIGEAIASASALDSEDAKKDAAWIGLILGTIKQNAAEMLSKATCGEEDGKALLNDIDNDQFIDIVEHLFEANYSGGLKKIPVMMEKWKPLFLKTTSSDPSPTSSEGTPSTASKTSTGKTSGKAA